MKWSVAGLVLVGLIASASAAVFVAAMRNGGLSQLWNPKEESPDVTVLVAAKDMAAMETLDESCVEKKTVEKKVAGESFYTDPVEVINRVLTVPMRKGEILTQAKLAPKDSSWKFASLLEEGTRAVSISLNDSGALYGLVYPGSLVDVVGTFKASSSVGGMGDTVSITVLQAVPVIGVQDETVVTREKEAEGGGDGKGGAAKASITTSRNRWIVTVMVTPEQAKSLALVMKAGELSLALRNPSDKTIPIERGPISLQELIRSPGGSGSAGPGALAALLEKVRALEGEKRPDRAARPGVRSLRAPSAEEEPGNRWVIQILRGSASSTVSLKLPGGGEVEAGPASPEAIGAGGIQQ